MTGVSDFTINDLQVFLLVFFRVSGMVMLAPLFGGEAVPRQLRAMLALVLAFLLFPIIDRAGIVVVPNLGFYAVAAATELAVGMILGFAAALLFTAAQFAGQLVDQELGLTLANIIDPITNEQVSVIGQFKMFLGMMIWLLIFGHHFIVQATFQSFESVPVLGFSFREAVALHLADDMMRDLFVAAFRIAAPAVVTLFLVTVAMAFMARVVPEMNIFILGFTLRIIVGLLVLVLVIGVFANTFWLQSERHDERVRELLDAMGNGK